MGRLPDAHGHGAWHAWHVGHVRVALGWWPMAGEQAGYRMDGLEAAPPSAAYLAPISHRLDGCLDDTCPHCLAAFLPHHLRERVQSGCN